MILPEAGGKSLAIVVTIFIIFIFFITLASSSENEYYCNAPRLQNDTIIKMNLPYTYSSIKIIHNNITNITENTTKLIIYPDFGHYKVIFTCNQSNQTNTSEFYYHAPLNFYSHPYIFLSDLVSVRLNNNTETKSRFPAPDAFTLTTRAPVNIMVYLFNHSFSIKNITGIKFNHTNTTFNITTDKNVTFNLNTSNYKSFCHLTNDLWNCIDINSPRLKLTSSPGIWKLIEKQHNIEFNYHTPEQLTFTSPIKWRQKLDIINYESNTIHINIKPKEGTFNQTVNKTTNNTVALKPGMNTFTLNFYTGMDVDVNEVNAYITSLLPDDAFHISITPEMDFNYTKKLITIKQSSPYVYRNIIIPYQPSNPSAYIIENNQKHYLKITQEDGYFVIHEEFI